MDKLIKNKNELSDSINIKNIIKLLKRESKLILIIASFSTVASSVFALNIKPVYQGSFNIVVKKEKDESSNVAFAFPAVINRISRRQENETQRLILNSPLILTPVYEYFQEYNLKKGIDVENITFKKWLKEFHINFQNDSSVLAVSYKSIDKDLILKTLELISSKYKSYSKRDTEKYITKTINYLENQKKVMEKMQRYLERPLINFQ